MFRHASQCWIWFLTSLLIWHLSFDLKRNITVDDFSKTVSFWNARFFGYKFIMYNIKKYNEWFRLKNFLKFGWLDCRQFQFSEMHCTFNVVKNPKKKILETTADVLCTTTQNLVHFDWWCSVFSGWGGGELWKRDLVV